MMQTYKVVTFITISTVASLLLLLTQNPVPVSAMPEMPKVMVETGLSPIVSPGPGQRLLTVPETIDFTILAGRVSNTRDSTIVKSANEPQLLYSELLRIAEMEDMPVESTLAELNMLLSDVDPAMRLAALESLALTDHPSSATMVTAALDDPLPQIRITALAALATQQNRENWVYIEPYLFDADHGVRLAAIEALTMLGSDSAIPSLAGLLSDESQQIRKFALDALGDIGGDNAIRYVLQASYDPDETIRTTAEAILADLN